MCKIDETKLCEYFRPRQDQTRATTVSASETGHVIRALRYS